MELLKEWAERLDGREIGREMSRDDVALAKRQGIVVAFGASDDLTEFLGAGYCDEVGAPGVTYWSKDGLWVKKCDAEDCPYEGAALRDTVPIESLWCDTRASRWTFRTDIPHETFRSMEDGEVFCVGIVFSLDKLAPGRPFGE